MIRQDYQRWRDFSLRMARTCFDDRRRPSVNWIVSMVEHVLDCFDDEEIATIVSWDQDSVYVCDRTHEVLYEFQPCWLWRFREEGVDADTEDRRDGLACEQWMEQWGAPVQCCVRAGIDLAVKQSGGVAGFTVADLRRMYPEGLPDWVSAGFVDEHETPVSLATFDDAEPVWL